MVGVHSFDAHQGGIEGMTGNLDRINADLTALHTDLQALGLWNATTLVTISDFGRTISTNGLGTDHAWGGNNFIVVTPDISHQFLCDLLFLRVQCALLSVCCAPCTPSHVHVRISVIMM